MVDFYDNLRKVKPGESYDSKQFFNFDNAVAGPGGRNQSGRLGKNPTNSIFAWPGDYRHHIDADGKMVAHKIDRGFMRILPYTLENGEKSVPKNYRLFFQFNPQTITRDVTMSENVYNPIMQTKEQLSQPIMAESTFAFDLMFDRSYELNRSTTQSSKKTKKSGSQVIDGDYSDSVDMGDSASNDLLTTLTPSQIGVLHDVRMLDAIVGQGITQEMVNFLTTRYNIYDKLKSTEEDGAVTTETDADGNTVVTTSGQPGTPTTIEEALNGNIGNQAFLLPNPVRVVFSSLFMVDGFVRSMGVRYVKFNTDMVPMMVLINIQMSAVYFGFARKNTAFTTALLNADINSITSSTVESTVAITESQKYLDDLFKKSLTKFYVHVGGTDNNDAPPTWGQTYNSDKNVRDEKSKTDINAKAVIGYNEDPLSLAAGFPNIPNDKDEDPIYLALKSGELSSIVLSEFTFEVKRDAFSGREKNIKHDDLMLSINWDPTALTVDGFSASGPGALNLWEEAQHQKDEGGGTMDATRVRIRTDTDNANRLFFGTDDEFDEFSKAKGKLKIYSKVRVLLTHADGTEWPKDLEGWREIEWWQNIKIELKYNARVTTRVPVDGDRVVAGPGVNTPI